MLDAVLNNKHASADEIYLVVRELDDKISRGTVYRNLKLLVEGGDLQLVEMEDVARYDWRLDDHYHVVCTNCGEILDAPLEYDLELDNIIKSKTHYGVLRHKITFEGICEACSKKIEDK